MPSANYIDPRVLMAQANGSGGGEIPTAQPTGSEPRMWVNAGVPTFWDGTVNRPLDFGAEPVVTDAFGNIIIED